MKKANFKTINLQSHVHQTRRIRPVEGVPVVKQLSTILTFASSSMFEQRCISTISPKTLFHPDALCVCIGSNCASGDAAGKLKPKRDGSLIRDTYLFAINFRKNRTGKSRNIRLTNICASVRMQVMSDGDRGKDCRVCWLHANSAHSQLLKTR